MYKLIRLSWIPVALCLSACNVQVNDWPDGVSHVVVPICGAGV